MPESLLGLVLERLDAIRSPVVFQSETVDFEAERQALVAAGVLRRTADAEEIPRPRRFPPGGNLVVRRTSRGIFGVAEEGDFFQPLPLVPEDVLQYEVSVAGLVAGIRHESEIDGTGGEESDGLVPVGQKSIEGRGVVSFFLSSPNDGEADVLARCHRVRRSPGAPPAVVLLPRALALSPEGQQVLEGLGVVLVPLLETGRRASLRLDWMRVFPPDSAGPGRSYSKETRILRKQGTSWLVVFEGTARTVADSKGMEYIAHLLGSAGQEIHCTNLRDVVAGETTKRHFGSAGEVITKDGLKEYADSLRENREEQEEARKAHDVGRLEKLQEVEAALQKEMDGATGLHGKRREVASDRKRAQQSISKAIHRAIDAILKEHQPLGQHLSRCLKIAEFLSYESDQPIPWAS